MDEGVLKVTELIKELEMQKDELQRDIAEAKMRTEVGTAGAQALMEFTQGIF